MKAKVFNVLFLNSIININEFIDKQCVSYANMNSVIKNL